MKQLTAAALVLVWIGTVHAQVKVNNSTLTRLVRTGSASLQRRLSRTSPEVPISG
jgi:hypothetical protein